MMGNNDECPRPADHPDGQHYGSCNCLTEDYIGGPLVAVALRLVPVEVFTGLCEHDDCTNPDHLGYGICDAVSSWSDCNRAVGQIYRVDDTPPEYREAGETITVYVEAADRAWFERKFGDGA